MARGGNWLILKQKILNRRKTEGAEMGKIIFGKMTFFSALSVFLLFNFQVLLVSCLAVGRFERNNPTNL